ncbi:MAG: hypothetical protein ABJA87_00355 [bacterium]
MPRPDLIESYLTELARHLPPSIVTELADGFTETYEVHLRRGLSGEDAARIAVAEFGEPTTVIAAFSQVNPARVAARSLLLFGPLVGAAWAALLLTQQAWTWPVAAAARFIFGAALLTAIVLLSAAALATRYRPAARSAAAACGIVVTLDLCLLGYTTTTGLLDVWPAPLAAALSITRIGFSLKRLPQLLTGC